MTKYPKPRYKPNLDSRFPDQQEPIAVWDDGRIIHGFRVRTEIDGKQQDAVSWQTLFDIAGRVFCRRDLRRNTVTSQRRRPWWNTHPIRWDADEGIWCLA